MDMDDKISIIMMASVAGVVIFLSGLFIGITKEKQRFEREAIRNNAATYITNNEGGAKWIWKKL